MKTFFLCVMVLTTLQVSAQNMVMNDETTDITFVTKHLLGNLEGSFKGVNGTAVFDTANLAGSFLKFAFASSTLVHNDYQLGPNLLKKECFDVKQFPTIELASSVITKLTAANHYQFNGTLQVKGITKPVSFNFTALPNVGGYDFTFTFPLAKKPYNLGCAFRSKLKISVRTYAKKTVSLQ